MKKIDTTYWKEFRVGDLFEIHPTKAYKLINVQLFNGGETPVVVNSAYNNGIGGFSTLLATEKGNMITFSDTVDANTIFYQERDFIGYPHVQGLYPIGNFSSCWTSYSMKFFASIFRKTAVSKGFDYGNKFRRDLAINILVKLPAKDDTPDWQYMEEYMRQIEQKTTSSITALKKSKYTGLKINPTYWKEFQMKELGFDNFHGRRLTKTDRIEGNIPFITAGKENQGVVGKIGNDRTTYQNPITIDMFGNVFYHKGDYAGDDNIYFFVNNHLNEFCKLFIVVSAQRLIKSTFEYKDQFRQDNADSLKILLPATPSGEPDWHYMEMYMRGVEAIVKNKLALLAPRKPEVTIKEAETVNFTNANVTYIDKSTNYNIKK